jgi:hypothetical protein
MKVKTDLKAGYTVNDISQEAGQVFQSVQDWFNNQGYQITNWSDAQINRAKNLWNCMLNA